MPPGEPQDPLFSPCYNQHHHSQQHGLILTGLAGVPSAFMWLLVLHRATLKRCQWELLWLFELCIRLICCPSQPYSFLSLSYYSIVLSLDVELSAEYKSCGNPPAGLETLNKTAKRGKSSYENCWSKSGRKNMKSALYVQVWGRIILFFRASLWTVTTTIPGT